jgi:hypothetical protein
MKGTTTEHHVLGPRKGRLKVFEGDKDQQELNFDWLIWTISKNYILDQLVKLTFLFPCLEFVPRVLKECTDLSAIHRVYRRSEVRSWIGDAYPLLMLFKPPADWSGWRHRCERKERR